MIFDIVILFSQNSLHSVVYSWENSNENWVEKWKIGWGSKFSLSYISFSMVWDSQQYYNLNLASGPDLVLLPFSMKQNEIW